MKESLINKIIPGFFVVLGIISLWLWLGSGLFVQLQERVPGMDKSGQGSSAEGSRTGPSGTLIKADGVPAEDLKSVWPCFRGENLDNISKDAFQPVPKGGGFQQLWGIDVGEGFAGAAIFNGRVLCARL